MFTCLDAKGENYIVEVDLPRVKKKDIDLSMLEDNGLLMVGLSLVRRILLLNISRAREYTFL